MRLTLSIPRKVLVALSATLVLSGIVGGCFSEHQVSPSTSGVCTIDLSDQFPGSTVVVIRSFAFTPGEVRIRAGERVTWINCDEDPHTSTSEGGVWASPFLAPGDAFTQTFSTAGEFPYFCEPHPFMLGRVVVE
jgi:plastocyanin